MAPDASDHNDKLSLPGKTLWINNIRVRVDVDSGAVEVRQSRLMSQNNSHHRTQLSTWNISSYLRSSWVAAGPSALSVPPQRPGCLLRWTPAEEDGEEHEEGAEEEEWSPGSQFFHCNHREEEKGRSEAEGRRQREQEREGERERDGEKRKII